jgi:hypothetical protein
VSFCDLQNSIIQNTIMQNTLLFMGVKTNSTFSIEIRYMLACIRLMIDVVYCSVLYMKTQQIFIFVIIPVASPLQILGKG